MCFHFVLSCQKASYYSVLGQILQCLKFFLILHLISFMLIVQLAACVSIVTKRTLHFGKTGTQYKTSCRK